MTKLLDCPYCDVKQEPVIDSAEVCSPKCRQRKKRKLDRAKLKESKDGMVTGRKCNI